MGGSSDILFRLSLQLIQRVRKKTKEDREAHSHNDAAHIASFMAWKVALQFGDGVVQAPVQNRILHQYLVETNVFGLAFS